MRLGHEKKPVHADVAEPRLDPGTNDRQKLPIGSTNVAALGSHHVQPEFSG
jgi:hypothetical protein